MSEWLAFVLKHQAQFILLGLAILALFLIEWMRVRRNSAAISVNDAILKMNREHAIVLDIRDEGSYAAGHIQDAISVTSDAKTFLAKQQNQKKLREKSYLIVCAQGVSAFKFANELMALGKTVFVLQGGMRAWIDANMPVIKSKNSSGEKKEKTDD